MKKRITAVLCAVCMICAMLPMTANAAGNLEGVDYSRITSGTSYKTVLQLDNMQFQGTLTQGSGVSQAEQDKIIRDVMNDKKITSGMLENAETIIKEAEQKGFELRDLENAILKMTGADTIVDLYKLIMGSGGTNETQNVLQNSGLAATEQYAKDISTTYVRKGGKLALKATTKVGFKLLFMLPDLVEVTVDMLSKYEELKDAIALSLEKKAMLDDFYDECNRRIKKAGGDSGEWLIRFDKAKARYSFNMWGIPTLLSEWTLTGELVRQVTGAGDNYGGTYQGTLMMEINGIEMDVRFDKNFKDKEIFFNGGGAYIQGEKTLWSNQGITNVKDDFKTTTLKRTVSGDFTVYIIEGSGEIKPTVLGSLKGGGDNTEFAFEHQFNGSGTFNGSIAVSGAIKYTSNDIKSYNYAVTEKTAGGVQLTDDLVSGTIQTNIGTVWKPLDSEPAITVYIK
ncbi:MAG: hypothetical protein LBJ11_03215 [Oscillospiraceae bacterium]|jgi:hypothetical protein|nr:hypothetical protein [Oscillospiraceae bacterium]